MGIHEGLGTMLIHCILKISFQARRRKNLEAVQVFLKRYVIPPYGSKSWIFLDNLTRIYPGNSRIFVSRI